MIIIANNTIEANEINKDYPANSIERKIVSILVQSSEKYVYDSLEQLKFELKLRKEIINAAIALNRSKMEFEVFRKSRCNTKYWGRTNEGGFVLLNGVKPSDAINDIFINGSEYATECATAMIIVYYKAMLSVYTEEVFNEKFSEIHLMNWHYIDRKLREIGQMRKTKDYIPGDRRYIINPDVNPLTPEWQGENVIDLSGGLYYGHGIGIHPADVIVRELNENRKEGADETAYLMDTTGRPNFKALY